jgi:hypothetical protein
MTATNENPNYFTDEVGIFYLFIFNILIVILDKRINTKTK